jgi:hypothetical protein
MEGKGRLDAESHTPGTQVLLTTPRLVKLTTDFTDKYWYPSLSVKIRG